MTAASRRLMRYRAKITTRLVSPSFTPGGTAPARGTRLSSQLRAMARAVKRAYRANRLLLISPSPLYPAVASKSELSPPRISTISRWGRHTMVSPARDTAPVRTQVRSPQLASITAACPSAI